MHPIQQHAPHSLRNCRRPCSSVPLGRSSLALHGVVVPVKITPSSSSAPQLDCGIRAVATYATEYKGERIDKRNMVIDMPELRETNEMLIERTGR
jgi:hypothetical protein